MQTYKYNAETKEYLYAEEAFLDPLETEQQGAPIYLLPADSTFDVPPAAKPGYVAMWNGTAWELVEDHRRKLDKGGVPVEGTGTPFWMPGDTWQTPARYMKELGRLPEGAMLERPEKPLEVIEAEEMQAAKAERAATVAASTVEVDGMIFDADEESQNRLSRGICAALALGLGPDQTTEWTLADNSAAQVTVRQMAQALLLAGQAQTAVWRKPYNTEAAE